MTDAADRVRPALSRRSSGCPRAGWRCRAAGPAAALALVACVACQRTEDRLAGGEPSSARRHGGDHAPPSGPAAALFSDAAGAAGLDFVHFNGMTGEYYMAEVTGAGAALFDYDNDGDLDVYLVQGALLGPGKTMDDALFPPPHPPPLRDRLFRNDLEIGEDGVPSLRFTDVTMASGIDAQGYGMGVAAGDYDNDGWIDLYVTNLGPNQLWRNRGDGTFVDVTAETGSGESRWSVPAVFFDYDRDGWLDLFVGNYIAATFENAPVCRDFTGAQDYCGPGSFAAEPDRLFRNRGDGTFEDVTAAAGMRSGFGGALGAVAADFDGDGWPDLYVANDGLPNNLWIQHRPGAFSDEARLAGCAVNGQGRAEASMGVDAADFDRDGDLDLFMTHLTGETNTLYINDGSGVFEDATVASGLGAPSRPYTSFGTSWLDFDGDGWLDLLVVSGAVKRIEALARAQDPFPLHQTNQLFRNTGDGRYEEVLGQSELQRSEVSRGAAFGDVDNDGDTDVLIANNNGPARLLLNQIGQRRHWLGVRAVGRDGRRDMLGARAVVLRPGEPPHVRRVHTDGSFASSNDPRALFGLGEDASAVTVRIHWPDGSAEEWSGLPVDRYTTLRQGTGTPVDPEET
ncbi:MAG TPA: CRTAC1 family protein [Thermoanaerobaculia bacterium]|nr:CRTAC1 family protein [Thermoanaerobaculia bacterium]